MLVRVTSLLEFRLRKANATLRTQIAPDVPPLAVPPHALEQILINLIANALDAVAGVAHPVVQVRAPRARRESALRRHRGRRQRLGRREGRPQPAVRVVLHDQGRGAGHRPRASRSAARSRAASGGDLELLDDPGAWSEPAVTVFRLTLPVSQEL